MKLSHVVVLTVLCATALPTIAQDMSKEGMGNFIKFFRSVRTPAVLEVCSPVVKDPAALAAAADAWLKANSKQIALGKEYSLAAGSTEETLVKDSADMQETIKKEFAEYSQAKKTEFCESAIKSYQL